MKSVLVSVVFALALAGGAVAAMGGIVGASPAPVAPATHSAAGLHIALPPSAS